MKSLRLLQIGDVHFPDKRNQQLIADAKDASLSADLVARISAPRLEVVFRRLASLADNKIDAVLCCGDLTSRGDIASFRTCLDHLSNCLGLRDPARWAAHQVHIVPGNHDIVRPSPGAEPDDARFQPLVDICAECGLPFMPVPQVRSVTLPGSPSAQVFSLNSCLGSGEVRRWPEAVRSHIEKALAEAASTMKADELFELQGEQLDTPAFSEADLDVLCNQVEKLSANTVPVVLAHHNLLPQAAPRLTVYGEPLNAGRLRRRLLGMRRPVVYCHGHTHDDPIEVLVNADYAGGPVLSVAAPCLFDGFNILELCFRAAGEELLGCVVSEFRYDASAIESRRRRRVPLAVGRTNDIVGRSPDLILLMRTLTDGSWHRLTGLRDEINKSRTPQMKLPTLASIAQEAEWLGLVAIEDREEVPKHWHLRRIGCG